MRQEYGEIVIKEDGIKKDIEKDIKKESIIEEKYIVEEELGSGGSGRVYKVYDIHLKCRRAMKEFEKENKISVRELEILKELRHPALPMVTDYIESCEYRYLIMEYIEGENLEKYLEEWGAICEAQAVEWAIQLADVLIYLHEREVPIIYRDMKPSNIIIDKNNRVRLVDFGTACRYYHEKEEIITVVGTYGYAAPEQFETGAGIKADVKCDIYGLGATLFHMLTGCNPSKPPYLMQPVRFYRQGLSSGLEEIVYKATMQERDRRYQTVRTLKDALDSYGKADDMKMCIGKVFSLLYNMAVLGSVFYLLLRCRQTGVLKGFTFFPVLLKEEKVRTELLISGGVFLLLWMGKQVLKRVRRSRLRSLCKESGNDGRLIKNVVLTEKKGKGLAVSVWILAAVLMFAGSPPVMNAAEKENKLTVNVRNEKGQKILIRYGAAYMPENAFRMELPLSNFESGEEYELRLECTNRKTKEKSSRTFYLKGLEP